MDEVRTGTSFKVNYVLRWTSFKVSYRGESTGWNIYVYNMTYRYFDFFYASHVPLKSHIKVICFLPRSTYDFLLSYPNPQNPNKIRLYDENKNMVIIIYNNHILFSFSFSPIILFLQGSHFTIFSFPIFYFSILLLSIPMSKICVLLWARNMSALNLINSSIPRYYTQNNTYVCMYVYM